jgi:hypothetical protein
MKYLIEVLNESGPEAPLACRSLSSAGTKALNLLNRMKDMDGFVCVRIIDEEGKEHARLICQPSN